MPDTASAPVSLQAAWRESLAVVNLRGRPDDGPFVDAAASALGLALPTQPCTTVTRAGLRILWAGPDDWFVIGPAGSQQAVCDGLRQATQGLHAAVTDVSSGYTVLRLDGPAERDVLAQGCPLDLHPRAFGPGHCAGSHFFKASVWLWRTDGDAGFELLVRRSFRGYVDELLDRATREGGITRSRF